jgi:hypothetical protein
MKSQKYRSNIIVIIGIAFYKATIGVFWKVFGATGQQIIDNYNFIIAFCNNASAKDEPINPAPPVINTFIPEIKN